MSTHVSFESGLQRSVRRRPLAWAGLPAKRSFTSGEATSCQLKRGDSPEVPDEGWRSLAGNAIHSRRSPGATVVSLSAPFVNASST